MVKEGGSEKHHETSESQRVKGGEEKERWEKENEEYTGVSILMKHNPHSFR